MSQRRTDALKAIENDIADQRRLLVATYAEWHKEWRALLRDELELRRLRERYDEQGSK